MEESKFRFLGYRISKIECIIEDNFDIKKNIFDQSIQVQIKYDKDDDCFVEVVLNIDVKSSDKAFSFFMIIKGGFKREKDMPTELFYVMARQNAPAILFPFARAIITSYTAQANIPPVILPLVNFTGQNQEKED